MILQLPIFVNANKYREIMDAIQWSKDEDIELNLIAGGDAWRAAEAIKAEDIAIIVNQVNSLPRRRWESYDTFFTNVLKLHESGVRFAIAFLLSFFAIHRRGEFLVFTLLFLPLPACFAE